MSRHFCIEDWKAYAAQCCYSINRMAKGKEITRQQLRRSFLQCVGKSPKEWVELERLEAAVRLLLDGKAVKQVSIELGFSDCSHFIRFFKRKVGRSPREFSKCSPGAIDRCKNVPQGQLL